MRDLAADGVAGAGHVAGDELVLFWETATDEQVFAAAEDVLAAVRAPIVIADERLVMTASIGVVIAGDEERQPEVLLREADVALARAKQQGRARFEVYDDLAHRRALERLRLQVDLRVALEQDELHLVYQPLVSLHDGRVCGVEALLRWQHLTRGAISPADFIPVAETSGLIVPIGLHVLRTACREAAAWAAAGTPVPVSVNVAVQQLARRGFAGDVQDALYRHGAGAVAPGARDHRDDAHGGQRQGPARGAARRARPWASPCTSTTSGRATRRWGRCATCRSTSSRSTAPSCPRSGSTRTASRSSRPSRRWPTSWGCASSPRASRTTPSATSSPQLGCDEAQGYLFAPPSPPEAVAGLLEAPVAPLAR